MQDSFNHAEQLDTRRRWAPEELLSRWLLQRAPIRLLRRRLERPPKDSGDEEEEEEEECGVTELRRAFLKSLSWGLDRSYCLQVMALLEKYPGDASVDEELVEAKCQALARSPSSLNIQYFKVDTHCGDGPSVSFEAREEVLVCHGSTGHRIWDAAYVLVDWLSSSPLMTSSKCTLELGAGVGFASVYLAAKYLGLNTRPPPSRCFIASDMEVVVDNATRPNVERNIRADGRLRSLVECSVIDWGDADSIPGDVDLVIGSDLLYDPKVVHVLAALLDKVHRDRPTVQVVLAQQVRQEATIELMLQLCPWLERRTVDPSLVVRSCNCFLIDDSTSYCLLEKTCR